MNGGIPELAIQHSIIFSPPMPPDRMVFLVLVLSSSSSHRLVTGPLSDASYMACSATMLWKCNHSLRFTLH